MFAQITDNTVHSIQPGYLQTVSNARDNGQVRAMNGIYKSDPSLITLLLALCIPGVAWRVPVCRVVHVSGAAAIVSPARVCFLVPR